MNKESDLENTSVNDRYAEGMHAVPPLMTGNYIPSGPNVEIDFSKFTYGLKQTSADKSDSEPVEYASSESDSSVEITTFMPAPVENALKIFCEPKVWIDAPIIEEYESDSDDDSVHMIGNKAHLADYQEFKGGSVAFEGSNGRITGKGKIKAGRVYNLETKRVEKNIHVNFVENKPNVAGKGHAWMFDLDYLTNSMNYEHVLVENQANKSAGPKQANNSVGTQVNDDQGANTEEIDLHDEHFVLPIWSAYSTNVKSSGDKIQKTTDCKTCEKPVSQVEQTFQEELEKLKRQEKEANDAVRKKTTHENQNANTNLLNVVSIPISTVGPSIALNDDEPSNLDDPLMPHLEDIYASLSEGIFTDSSYDDEGVDNYVVEILKKFDFLSVKTASTPIETQKPLVKDEEVVDMDVQLYRRLISWQCKKHTIMATSTTKAEYVAAAHCCG
nr:ribonuclease H-like domain-containing protein [Tanacetum cinerariifolium]